MKKNLLSFSLAVLLLAGGIEPVCSQDIQKETRETGKFTKIGLAIDADVYLEQGKTSVVIEAETKMLELIETIVEDNALKIKYNTKQVPRHEKIKVYISMPEVEGLSIAGSGDIVAEKSVKAGELALAIAGSGNISLKALDVTNLKAAISGSGDITLSGGGKSGTLKVGISGSGDVKAEGLLFTEANIGISGSGDCVVNVADKLDVGISGSGDVSYTGNPKVNARVSGSGSVHGK